MCSVARIPSQKNIEGDPAKCASHAPTPASAPPETACPGTRFEAARAKLAQERAELRKDARRRCRAGGRCSVGRRDLHLRGGKVPMTT